MGRNKNTPKKYDADISHVCLDYIPVFKKRRTKVVNSTEKFININSPSDECKKWYLGELLIGSTNNTFPDEYKSVKVSFKLRDSNLEDKNNCDSVIILCDSVSIIVTNYNHNAAFIKDLMNTTKTFSFDFVSRDENLYLKIYFTVLPLPKFTARIGNCLKKLFIQLFGEVCANKYDSIERPRKTLHGNSELQKLYMKLTEKRVSEELSNTPEEDVQHPNLKPDLRPYQQKSVRWMLQREKMEDSKTDFLHPLYTPVKLETGIDIYFDKYTGFVCSEKPLSTLSGKVGILADEMGLGKTVEVLACILLNPKIEETDTDKTTLDEPNDSDTTLMNRKRSSVVHSDGESGSPLIKVQKKRKKLVTESKESQCIDKSQNVTVPQDWVQKKKSNTYIALNMWYNSILSEMSTVSSDSIENPDKKSVQCICGSTSEEHIIKCSSCYIYQHPQCLGYERSFGQYFCPQCWTGQPLLESKATLIVTPISLKTQWCQEINKHITGNFKVLQYYGHSRAHVYPTELKEYDIVLTTYSVLQHELKLMGNTEPKNLRREKKYVNPGSSLTRIKWWRLCLDEAQAVDTPDRLVSVMARRIEAVHRWAVTGTPISKNISDLYGLIDYLQISPYDDVTTWQNILYQPYLFGDEEPLLNFLFKVLRRTAKKDVADQINIPKQTYVHYMLDFCAVEKYFYKQEHETRSNFFRERCIGYDPTVCLESLDKKHLKRLLEPVLSLRQICVTMTTQKGTFSRKQVKSMKDLLDALILGSTNDTEECLRLLISSYNGMAGVYLLLQKPQEAIDTYREVLQLVAKFSGDDNKTKLNVDKPQYIHTLYNLAEILEIHTPEHPTLRDEDLRKDCEELEKKYLEKFISESYTAYESFQSFMLSIEKLQQTFVLEDGQWISDGLNWIRINGHYEELEARIITACDQASMLNEVRRCNEMTTLRIFLHIWQQELSDLREKLFTVITDMYDYQPTSVHKIVINKSLVTKAMNCHLRPQKKGKQKSSKCPVCVSDEYLKNYEAKLFNMTQRGKMFEEMSLQGNWKPTLQEIIIKSIHGLLKIKDSDPNYIKDGGIHINMINTMKKEFKELRKFWTFLDQQICAMDELDICKIRLQLKSDEEQKKTNKTLQNLTYVQENKYETIHLLSVHELDYQLMLLQNDIKDNTAKLEKLLGTHSYLETLRKQQYEGQSPDPCPICHNQLEEHWSILSCGHCYCLECIQVLLEQVVGEVIKCCVCRNRQYYHQVAYINAKEDPVDDVTTVKGSNSTKINEMIKVLLELKQKDTNVKVLVFSSWTKVLDTIKQALEKNFISSEYVQTANIDVKITNFKDPNKNINVLLLPVNLGSKGLNLTEANHIMFAEPLVNPADELQAIGRINRIGQKKETFIHKFLMKNTIEENIHQATTSNAENWEKGSVTIQHMLDLFKVPDLLEPSDGDR